MKSELNYDSDPAEWVEHTPRPRLYPIRGLGYHENPNILAESEAEKAIFVPQPFNAPLPHSKAGRALKAYRASRQGEVQS